MYDGAVGKRIRRMEQDGFVGYVDGYGNRRSDCPFFPGGVVDSVEEEKPGNTGGSLFCRGSGVYCIRPVAGAGMSSFFPDKSIAFVRFYQRACLGFCAVRRISGGNF